ncbi:MAG: hypothetical protein AAGA56_16185, partial [Myxococcota bacterium]
MGEMSNRSARRWVKGAALAAVVAATACGSRSTLDAPFGARPEQQPPPPASEPLVGPKCAVFSSSSTLAPLDLVFMVDTSGSMSEQLADGSTKWRSVSQALLGFIYDRDSTGISLSLGFFPRVTSPAEVGCTPGVQTPDCTSCRGAAACERGFQPDGLEQCIVSSDCNQGGACLQLGMCSDGLTQLCLMGGDPASNPCPDGVACEPVGYCEDAIGCETSDYPSTPFEQIPLRAGMVEKSLRLRHVGGATPTLPA